MIKPIRTSADLVAAKRRVSQLISSNATGAHDDEIEVLSTLIEQCEGALASITAPSPIAAIRFRMDQMGMTPRQLEPFIGSRARVSEVLSGKRQLSIDMIRSLHEGIGIPYESLIGRRQRVAEIAPSESAEVTDMGITDQEYGMQSHLSFLADGRFPVALHRETRTQRAASKTDQTAVTLWQKAILEKSERQSIGKTFDRVEFDSLALRNLARLSTRPDGPMRAVDALRRYGVAIVMLAPLRGMFLDGVAMAASSGTPVIGLTLRHDRLDSFWFTVLHEAAHISLHYDYLLTSGNAFIDDMDIQSEDSFEREADLLARESLIPTPILSQIPWDGNTTYDELVTLSVRARVHIAVAAGRWQRDHQNYRKFSRLVERGTLRTTFEKAMEIDETREIARG